MKTDIAEMTEEDRTLGPPKEYPDEQPGIAWAYVAPAAVAGVVLGFLTVYAFKNSGEKVKTE